VLDEPAIKVMDNAKEALVTTKELEGDDDAKSVGHDRKSGDDEGEKIGQNILRMKLLQGRECRQRMFQCGTILLLL